MPNTNTNTSTNTNTNTNTKFVFVLSSMLNCIWMRWTSFQRMTSRKLKKTCTKETQRLKDDKCQAKDTDKTCMENFGDEQLQIKQIWEKTLRRGGFLE